MEMIADFLGTGSAKENLVCSGCWLEESSGNGTFADVQDKEWL